MYLCNLKLTLICSDNLGGYLRASLYPHGHSTSFGTVELHLCMV